MKSLREIYSSRRSVLLAAGIVIVCIAAFYFVLVRSRASGDTYLTQAVQRGPIQNVVNATGTVQAVLTVQVGSQVSGQIQVLYADYNSVVRRGQLLARIDPRNFEAQAEQAKANLAATEARVRSVEADLNTPIANLQSAKANLEAARVTRNNTAQILERYQELQQQGILSQNDYDNAQANAESAQAKYNQAVAQVEQVQAQTNAGRAQVEQAKAQVEQAQAGLHQAQVNLDYTSINSPVDGVVVSRNVDVGQTVAASLQAPTLFVIANDLTQMQVNASVDEADIGSISEAVDVRFSVDAYPNRFFAGQVAEIRLNPQTLQNVVTYDVIVNVDNERLELKPGMTANLTFAVAQRDDVLKVPNAALRFLPAGITRQQVMEMTSQAREENALVAATRGAAGQGETGLPLSKSSPSSPQAETRPLAQQMQDPNLTPEQRHALLQRLPELSEEQRQKMRESFGGGPPAGRAWPGQPSRRGLTQSESGAVAALAPGQMWDPSEKIRFPESSRQTTRSSIVWVLGPGNKPEPRRVLLGITDGVYTEIVSGDIRENEKVILGDTSAMAAQQNSAPGFRVPIGGPMGGFGRGGGPPH